MKKLALLLLIVAFAGAAAVLVPFFRHHADKNTAGADAAPDSKDKTKEPADKDSGEKKNESVVKMDKETQERVALEVKPLEAIKQRPEVVAYGRAIDASALAALDGDIVAADAALQASEAAATRAQSLFASGENVSRKALETAVSQFQADRSRARALHRRLSLEWGASIAAMDDKARSDLLDELVKDKAALVRVDVPGGESVKQDPSAGRIVVLGREDQSIPAATVAPASSIDPKTQAQGFLLQINNSAFPIRSGVAVTAYLDLPGEEAEGVVVPRSAIVRYAGEAWAYVQTGEEEFERRRVPAGSIVEQGWFVTEGFMAGDKIVAAGAQTLLSSEMTLQNAGEAD
jgi:hypothetical protein